MGMFAPPPSAAVSPPSPALPVTAPPVAAAPPMPAAAPGVTSYTPPAQPFSPPPPSGGQAGGLKPGMLNAAALRGPVATMPLTTTATSTLATAAQPLAYVPPDIPRPIPSTTPPPLSDPGTAQSLNPPPPAQLPQPAQPAHQPAAPQTGPPPGPSTGSGDPHGSGGPGAQMPGSGTGQAPPAPPPAIPLDTRPPIPPPPGPGQPPPLRPSPPSWAHPPVPQSVQAALDELDRLEKLIQLHNSKPPDQSNLPAVLDYNAEADYYNSWAAQLQGELDSSNTQYAPATTARTAEIPSWTQPAPQQPVQQGPSSPPQPLSPSLTEQAKQIGQEISGLPKGTRSDAIADRVSGLHLNQEQAAEAADIAAQAAFGDTSGIASLPNGTKVVLPLRIDQGIALMVHPDGSVSVFRGDLFQFLPFLGK